MCAAAGRTLSWKRREACYIERRASQNTRNTFTTKRLRIEAADWGGGGPNSSAGRVNEVLRHPLLEVTRLLVPLRDEFVDSVELHGVARPCRARKAVDGVGPP